MTETADRLSLSELLIKKGLATSNRQARVTHYHDKEPIKTLSPLNNLLTDIAAKNHLFGTSKTPANFQIRLKH